MSGKATIGEVLAQAVILANESMGSLTTDVMSLSVSCCESLKQKTINIALTVRLPEPDTETPTELDA